MATTNADGSIVINTKIDQSGFKEGLKKINASALSALNDILFTTLKIGTAVKGVVSGIVGKVTGVASKIGTILSKTLLGVFAVLALSIGKIFGALREAVGDALQLRGEGVTKKVEAIKHSFEELKAAVGAAFLPLIEAAIPYIQMAVDWLTKMVNQLAQVVAAWFGQKEALQITAGSAAKLAKETEKTKKAAQGALAAFDQINVLQGPKTDTEDLPKVAGEMLPITNNILDRVQAIKDEIAEWFADPIGKIKETWGKIVDWFRTNVIDPIAEWWRSTWIGNIVSQMWENFIGTWSKIIANIGNTIGEVKESIIQFFTGVMNFVHGVFTGDWELAWQGLKEIVAGVFGAISALAQGMINNFGIALRGNVNQLRIIFESLPVWLTGAFGAVLDRIKDKFFDVFSSISNFVGGVLSNIISFFSNMVQTILDGLAALTGGASTVGNIGTHVQIPTTRIPRLATGAVIPPGSEFLAVLGDQRSGTNLEAPAAMFQEMLDKAVASGGGGELTIPITLTLDGETVYRNQKRVSLRHGKSLISSGGV